MKFLTILLAFSLTGCAAQYKVLSYEDYEDMTSQKTVVLTMFEDSQPVICGNPTSNQMTLGCSSRHRKNVCVINAYRPKSQKDVVQNIVLGHELMHCLGANHE